MIDPIATTDAPTADCGFSGRDLCCIRGERVVFARLDFMLRPGDALVLLGPNGSGKSSLLRLMAGLIPPARGELRWNGNPERRLHYVGHADVTKPMLTVSENLDFWTRLNGGDARSVFPALERFGLGNLHDTPGRFLSAGQKRRLTLARLLTISAPLWLLDEPSVGLDAASQIILETAITDHRAGGGMVAASTHTTLTLPDHLCLHLADYASREDYAPREDGETLP